MIVGGEGAFFHVSETRYASAARLAPRPGLEPGTYPLGGGRAIQLCHRGVAQSDRLLQTLVRFELYSEAHAIEQRADTNDVEVQVRTGGVAGIAQVGDDLPALHLIADFDPNAAVLHVNIVGDAAVAVLND